MSHKLQVVDACSGLRYVIPLMLLALLIGHFFTRGLGRRLILLAAVLPLSIIMNSLRIYATGLLIVNGHEKVADRFFHGFSGWIVFIVTGAVLFGISMLLKKNDKKPKERAPQDPSGSFQWKWLPPILTALVCALFVGSGWAVQKIPAVRNLPERFTFESFPMKIGQWQGTRTYLSESMLDSLWADDYVTATYRSASPVNQIYLLIPFYEYQATKHTAHAPQSCLLGGGFTILKSDERVLQFDNEERLKLRIMLMKKGEHRMLSSYFFSSGGGFSPALV